MDDAATTGKDIQRPIPGDDPNLKFGNDGLSGEPKPGTGPGVNGDYSGFHERKFDGVGPALQYSKGDLLGNASRAGYETVQQIPDAKGADRLTVPPVPKAFNDDIVTNEDRTTPG